MEMWKITYEQRRILGWEFMWTCLFHKGFTSWRRQIYVYIYVYINHHGRVTPRWSGYNLLWSKLQHPCAGWCVSTPLSCLKKRQANQHSLSAAVEQLLVWRSDGHMIIHLQPLQRCSWSIISMDGVHHLHGWCASSLWSLKWSMRLHKIASRKRILKEDTVYSMIATSCCHVLTYTESYDGLFFWCHYISDHTSKIIQYEKSWVSTMWNFPKAEKGEQEYWICQQQTNDQTAKKCRIMQLTTQTRNICMKIWLTTEWLCYGIFLGISIVVERPKQFTWKSLTQAATLVSLKQCYYPLANQHGNENWPFPKVHTYWNCARFIATS